MPNIDRVANVGIELASVGVQQAGFGVPLIAVQEVPAGWGSELVRAYTSAAAVLADGFDANSFAHRAATVAFSQEDSPEQIKIGKVNIMTQSIELQVVTALPEGGVYTFTVWDDDGTSTAISYTADVGDTAADVALALELLIDAALGTGYDVTAATDTITIDNATGNTVPFRVRFPTQQQANYIQITDASTSAGTDLTAALAAIQAVDPDWFGLVLEVQAADPGLEAAAWAEANGKFFVAGCSDADLFTTDTTDFASAIQDASYDQTFVRATRQETSSLDAVAICARMLATVPGSSTWYAKTLVGVSPDNLSDTHMNNLIAKNASGYVTVGGVNSTFPPQSAVKSGSGEWADVIRLIMWTEARIREALWQRQLANPKVPYTATGTAILEDAVREVLSQGVANGGYSEYTVTTPSIATQSTANRTNRVFENMSASATLAGAIHYGTINVRVSP